MGRTNPTFRDAVRAIEERWADYRRALRRRDQPRFDRLFDYAREHADAGGLLNHETPLLPCLFGVALEQERRIDEQAERIDELERRLAAIDGRAEPTDGGARADASTAPADEGARDDTPTAPADEGDDTAGGERPGGD